MSQQRSRSELSNLDGNDSTEEEILDSSFHRCSDNYLLGFFSTEISSQSDIFFKRRPRGKRIDFEGWAAIGVEELMNLKEKKEEWEGERKKSKRK